MGRPRKQTVDYFPHFVSTDSRTKFILEQSWGNDGYAFWFKLLELLGRSEGHYYDCSATANEKYLVALMKLDKDTISEILEVLADLGNIDKELWEERKVIWCQSLVDNLQDVYSKRTVSAPKRPFTEPTEEESPAPPATAEEKPPEDKPKKRGRPPGTGTKTGFGINCLSRKRLSYFFEASTACMIFSVMASSGVGSIFAQALSAVARSTFFGYAA